jgi:ATP-binding cassette subfamily B protein
MSPRRRKHLSLTMALMLFGAAAEIFAIGSVIPFLALIASPNSALISGRLRHILDLAPGGPMVGAALLLAGAAILVAAVRLWLLWTSRSFAVDWGGELATQIFNRMLRQPYSAYLDRNSSELVSGFEKANRVTATLQPALEGAIAAALALCIAALLLAIDPVAASITAASIGLAYALISLVTTRRLANNSVIIASELTARTRIVREALGGIRDILLDGSQAAFGQKFAQIEHRARRAMAQNGFIAGAPRFVLESTGIIVLSFVALLLSARSGGIVGAIPLLGVLGLGAQRLLPLLQQAWVGWSQVSANMQAIVDVADLLALPIEAEGMGGSTPLPLHKSIELRAVSFAYSTGRQALEEVSLSIRPGERVGIAGATGSGKSTLVDVLLGFLEPTAGTRTIDGRPLDATARRRWRGNIAHVSQSTYLSDDSIAANITWGTAWAIDVDRLRAAIDEAQLGAFIASLPEGASTTVGERGVRLSGGQRQRIGIARALYRGARILVLDEATSALDGETERKLVEGLARLDRDKTLIVVSHRASMLSLCDRVITLEHGRVVNSGCTLDADGPLLGSGEGARPQ